MSRTLLFARRGGYVVAAAVLVSSAFAHAPSGAIFTTLSDGSEVNLNQFPSKQAVYLDGGPGIQAPQTAAGLDDGTYVFQVTDPPGKALLSTDLARCRQFTVLNGVINGVVAQFDNCQHQTGFDVDHGAVTVQLFPYLDTPNNGGVYKAWVVRVDDFLQGCAEFGVPNGLNAVDCGYDGGNAHGFVGGHHKTDNFKVKSGPPLEIDVRFTNVRTGAPILGLGANWIDTTGGQNKKWSYNRPEILVYNEAHVENVESGNHQVVIENQTGCAVGELYLTRSAPKTKSSSTYVGFGPQTVWVRVSPSDKDASYLIFVNCY